ncbi:MAG: helicase-related protein [Infirmifilum sp.]
MAVELAREVLSIYKRYNPIFRAALAKAKPAVEPFLHQLEFLARTLLRYPLRAFVADEIGLGKTVTAILAMERLRDLGLAKRVLILVPRILVKQWVGELDRFHVIPQRIERNNFRALAERGFPEGVYVASMDLVKRQRYFDAITRVGWDLVIVDEAHRVGRSRGKKLTYRYKLVAELAREGGRGLLLLSATPHRGDPSDYLSRMRLLDPFLANDDKALDNPQFYAYSRNVLIFRRTKPDVNYVYEERKVFPDCNVIAVVVSATNDEKEFHHRLIRFLRTKILEYHRRTGTEPRAVGLLNALIFKRASSSPYAAIKTMEVILTKRAATLDLRKLDSRRFEKILSRRGRLAKAVLGLGFEELESEEDPDRVVEEFAETCSALLNEDDVKELKDLVNLAKRCMERDSRLEAVSRLVEQHVRAGEKVLVFTEFKDTARYVAEELARRLGGDRVAVLTSEEAASDKELMKIRRWLEREGGRVLVATDVASEGLNLQVANILVNYEPPWSPVKLEQRIGRVWRLGQVRNVSVYTVFLAVESDKDVLDVLYAKLVAMGRALGRLEKPPVGEEALVIDLWQRSQTPPIMVRRGEKLSRVSEYTLRREYLAGGREALDKLVNAIVNTIQQLQEALEKVGGFSRPRRDEVERFMREAVGFASAREAGEAVARLLRAFKGRVDVVVSIGDQPFVRSPGGTLVPISRTWEALSAFLEREDRARRLRTPIYVVARGEREREVCIYEVPIRLKSGAVVYSEIVGVDGEGRVMRGAELLNLIAEALGREVFEANEFSMDGESCSATLRKFATDLIKHLLKDLNGYRLALIHSRLRQKEKECEEPLMQFAPTNFRLLGVIRFAGEKELRAEAEVSPEERRRIEEEAMRIALEYERRHGREPVDVSQSEHYDIYSVDPRTNEERFIEVKGHQGSSLLAELTEDEYRVAQQLRERYWLYIVSNIGTGSPRLVAIRDPLSKMRVEMRGTVRFLLKPGDAGG